METIRRLRFAPHGRLIFAGVCCVFAAGVGAVAGYAGATGYHWAIVALCAAVALSFAVVCGRQFFRLKLPDFVTSQGAGVWLPWEYDPEGPWRPTFELAIRAFERYMPALADLYVPRDMWRGAAIFVSLGHIERSGRNYAGVQSGDSIAFRWSSGFGANAFFHEALHLLYYRRGEDPDSDHSNGDWAAITELKRVWREEIGTELPGEGGRYK